MSDRPARRYYRLDERVEVVLESRVEHRVRVAGPPPVFGGDYWLGQMIRRAEKIRSSLPADMLDYFHQVGFEIM